MDIKVYQIYFSDFTKGFLDPKFIPYLNLEKDGYFENTVFKKVYEQNPSCDYIGFFSWKQYEKTHFTGDEMFSHIESDKLKGELKDVYLIPPTGKIVENYENVPDGYKANGIINSHDIWYDHKLNKNIYQMDILLNNAKVLPFNLFDGKWQYCHGNYWVIRKSIFDEYFKTIVSPVMDFFERPDIKSKTKSWFRHAHENIKYPGYSFTMEGLFGAFLAHSSYSFSYLIKKRFSRPRKSYDKVNILGYKRIK